MCPERKITKRLKALKGPVKRGVGTAVFWYGGKGILCRRLRPLFPPHKRYVEPFGGGASVLLSKEPVEVEVYNDLDSGLADFFRVMADPEVFQRFYRHIEALPSSRQIYLEYVDTWKRERDPAVRVAKWFVVARQSFNGRFGKGWRFDSQRTIMGCGQAVRAWLQAVEKLPEIHFRLLHVQVENDDFREILPRYDTPDTLFYCDPPYVHATRGEVRYDLDMPDDDHRELVDMLLKLKGMVALSGYANTLYTVLEDNGWNRRDLVVTCPSASRDYGTGNIPRGERTESLWRNPQAMKAWKLAKARKPLVIGR